LSPAVKRVLAPLVVVVVVPCTAHVALADDAPSADADPLPVKMVHREVLILKDGSVVQGVLVEKVDNDHVTIMAPGGAKRTIAWADLAQPPQDVTIPEPPAPGTPAGTDSQVITTWPEPDRVPTAFRAMHMLVGFAGGANSLGTNAGVSAEFDPEAWFGLELDLGKSTGNLLATIGSVRFRFAKTSYHHARLGLDFAYTIAGTTSVVTEAGSPSTADFATAGAFLDVAPRPNLLLRAEVGLDLLSNGVDFCMNCPGNDGQHVIYPMFRLGVSWMFDL
jgi:hypothetical protein